MGLASGPWSAQTKQRSSQRTFLNARRVDRICPYDLVAPSDQSGRGLRPRSVLSTQQRDAERDPGTFEDEEVDIVDRTDVQGDRDEDAGAPTSGSTRAAECVAERGRRVASEAP